MKTIFQPYEIQNEFLENHQRGECRDRRRAGTGRRELIEGPQQEPMRLHPGQILFNRAKAGGTTKTFFLTPSVPLVSFCGNARAVSEQAGGRALFLLSSFPKELP